eukprot:jgi/Chrzof1/9039/Cz03g33260.t1
MLARISSLHGFSCLEACATATRLSLGDNPIPFQQVAHSKVPKVPKMQPKAKKQKAQEGQAASATQAADYEDDQLRVEPDAVKLVLKAIDNVTPHLDVRTMKQATKVVYVPSVMPPSKGRSLALHWLVKAAEVRHKSVKGRFAECLALEILNAYQERGPARQRRDELHKLALNNRTNVHLRWW